MNDDKKEYQMAYGNDKNANKRRLGDYDWEYRTRDGSYIFWPDHKERDRSDSSYFREFYRGTKGRQSKVFRPSKPRWKK